MIKKTHILFILLPFIGWGQFYSVTYSFTETMFNDSGPGTPYFLELYNTLTGESYTLAQASFGQGVSVNPPQEVVVGFKPNQLRTRIAFVPVDSQDIVYTPAGSDCYGGYIPVSDPNGQTLNVSLDIEPDLTVYVTPGLPSYPSSCETVNLYASDTFIPVNPDVYTWEYSINGGINWTELTDFHGINTFDVAFTDIPGLVVNQNIFFRLRYCTGRVSNAVITHFIKCSPDLTSLVPSPTSCSYSNNGGFAATFSRVLNAGESLLLNLAQNAPVGDPGSILVAAPIITSANMVGSTYNWPNTLAAGTYYLRYQLDNDGSVYDYGPFNITTPTPVTFDAMWMNINCFGETGSIDITANGGVGNYQYELNGNGSWVNFTNPNEHLVTGLLTGNYQLRVRDANGCTEQN